MRTNLYKLNRNLSIVMILFGLLLIVITEATVTDMTPGKYGASPKDMPFFVGGAIAVFSIILLVNTRINKNGLKEKEIELIEKQEPYRLAKYVLVLVAIPAIMPITGFYTSIVAGLLALLLISKVRNVFVIIFSLIGIIIVIYLLLVQLSHKHLPGGLLI